MYSIKRRSIRDTRLAPRLMFSVFTDEAHFCVRDRVGYFFLLATFPSLEEELSDLNDKLSGGERQRQNFIKIHSSLQFDYSSLAAGRAWGKPPMSRMRILL